MSDEQVRDEAEEEFDPLAQARTMGYTEEQIASVPAEAVMGYGCANPLAFAALREGESVLDLGCGGGFDALLAAQEVGPEGSVVGVDSDAEMVELARRNAAESGAGNVTFEVAQMSDLPLEDASLDVVISNCVINHSLDLEAVFGEIRRCLRPNGRMVIADLVLEEPLGAEQLRQVPEAWREWLDLAVARKEYLRSIGRAALRDMEVAEDCPFNLAEGHGALAGGLASLVIRARR